MKARIEKGKLVIELPLEKPRPSATGKTLLIATTRGVRRSGARFNGQTISVVANAFIYPDVTSESSVEKPWRNRLEENEVDEEDDDEQKDDEEGED